MFEFPRKYENRMPQLRKMGYQRGSNEQVNGLIRRYLPKRTSFKSVTQDQLDQIVERINNRPRKCLGFRTPNEVFKEQREKHLRALRILLKINLST